MRRRSPSSSTPNTSGSRRAAPSSPNNLVSPSSSTSTIRSAMKAKPPDLYRKEDRDRLIFSHLTMDKSPDLCDWEVLQNSDASDSAAEELAEMEQQLDSSDVVFQPDYFSFDSHQKPPSSDDGSAVSDNPSWIDSASDAPFPLPLPRNSADFWFDSGSDRSVSRRLIEGDDKLEPLESVKFWSDSGEPFNLDYNNESLEELGVQVESKLGFDSCGVGRGILQYPMEHENDESTHADGGNEEGDKVDVDGGVTDSTDSLATEEMKAAEEKEVSDKAVWWKLPLDLFKYCAFRVSPVWSLSVAAAFVGFVILGRRLYKMKRKTQGLHLKVIIDDKRVSQFMTNAAARLNEAFSLVRRVPIIRPSLPSPGAAPWPVMSMR